MSNFSFFDYKKPICTPLWFRAIWYITSLKNGTSALGLQGVLGLGSYRTAWTWLHKLRRAMVRPGRDKLKGSIEVDEAFIGAPHKGGKCGRGAENKVLVALAVEVNDNKIGRIRMGVIDDASSESLHSFIELVAEKGYTQEVKLHKNDYQETLLPHVHTVISLLKRWLL